MSKFFKALEQAEREQGLPRHAAPRNETPPEGMPRVRTVEPRRPTGPGSPPPDARPATARIRSAEGFGREERGPDPRVPAEIPGGIDQHLVSLLNPTGFAAEQYRTLRHLVERWHKDAGLCVVAVTSPAVGDGKTITAINLAGALAQAPDTRVLLVDADLRRPSMARYLGLNGFGSAGLVDAILDRALSLESVVRPCPPFNLTLLPAGRPPAASYELLKSPRLGELLDEAKRRYDYILLDTPPVAPFPDCRLIGKWVDGFLFTVSAHKTPRKLLEEALHVVDPAKTLGLVFNGDDRPVSGYYHDGGSPDGGWTERLPRIFRKALSAKR